MLIMNTGPDELDKISFTFDPKEETASNLIYIRKESLDLFNRLHSIAEDIYFVNQVHDAYRNIPLLPNLRCGAWYTDPVVAFHIRAYFKSTDGHFANWSFNLRRANLHLLPFILQHSGMLLIDSTRSGKRIPDSLSKTVPIWCAVINRAILCLYPETTSLSNIEWDVNLYTPPGAVSSQEHHQIEQRLDGWADTLAKSSYTLPRLPCPLRPVWITPATSIFPTLPSISSGTCKFLPVICVSASKQVHEGIERRSSGFVYIQGSGDDHELWGMGLTPKLFWQHREEILATSRSELSDLVASLVSVSRENKYAEETPPTPIMKVSGHILLCSISDLPSNLTTPATLPIPSITTCETEIVYLLVGGEQGTNSRNGLNFDMSPILRIATPGGKKGQMHFLQSVLPRSMTFIESHLSKRSRVCIACETGVDIGVGVALAALQKFFNDDGNFFGNSQQSNSPSKQSVRTRLDWIISSRPQANPSRTTLKRVNEFLLTPSSFRASMLKHSNPQSWTSST